MPSPYSSLVSKYLYIRKAWVFLCETLTNEEVCKQINEAKEVERLTGDDIYETFDSFVSDFQSLPVSWFSR